GGVFGLVADAAGSTGNFAASPLAPSASWSAGGNSGGFSWSYPLVMPASPGGLGPSLGVSYSSQAVEGINSDVAAQAGVMGLGWDLAGGGYIERRYVACTDPAIGGAVRANCWAGYNASIVLGG
ncbi:MAG TPA: hypothetical protein PLV68_13325, partial [Ilumatobacteraceae bacterium]|nr:hypothetical protein [Ilumatobacteraceae bacterium]